MLGAGLGEFGRESGPCRLAVQAGTVGERPVLGLQRLEAPPCGLGLGAHQGEVVGEAVEFAVLRHESADERPRLTAPEHRAGAGKRLLGEAVERGDDADHLAVDDGSGRDPVRQMRREGVAGRPKQADAEKHAVKAPGKHGTRPLKPNGFFVVIG